MIDVIIPVYNLMKRGLDRVYYSCLSLEEQNCNIWVINGSNQKEFNSLNNKLTRLRVNHIHFPMNEFNKPKLLNKGIQLSKATYILCTDADYLFKYDFIETCEKNVNEKRMLLKAVGLLPKIRIYHHKISAWRFPKTALYIHKGKYGENLANGGCQLAIRKWFLLNPYNERMSGWGGMDNLCVNTARKTLEIFWLKESEILHQYHRQEKNLTEKDKELFNCNQQILNDETARINKHI